MTPESIVVSLALAKKLKAQGWPQDLAHGGWFYCGHCEELHLCVMDNDEHCLCGQDYMHHVPEDLKEGWWIAPQAEEILRRLPAFIPESTSGVTGDLRIAPHPCNAVFYDFQYTKTEHKYEPMKIGDTLADACAAMWLYLSEHGFLPEP